MSHYRILLLDTETNGLPTDRNAPPSQFQKYPPILQLSWSIYEIILKGEIRELRHIKSQDFNLLLSPEIPWNADAARFHKRIEADCRNPAKTVSPKYALRALQADLRSVACVMAHNLAFDKPIIQSAGYREGIPDIWSPQGSVQEFCTMRATQPLLKLPATAKQLAYSGLSPYKAPNLSELYEWVWGSTPDSNKAHTSAGDVASLSECVAGLLADGLLTLQPVESGAIHVVVVVTETP